MIYEDSLQFIEINTGNINKTIELSPKIYKSYTSDAKFYKDQFTYLSVDTTYVTFDIKTEIINSNLKSPYKSLTSWMQESPENIIIEIDGENIIAFQKNNSNAEHFNILWEKEFDEGEQFSLNNNFISFVIKDSNLYKFADVYTGEVVNEYYSLSGNNSFYNKYDNGLFYINSRNKLYSIEPNTKWE